MSCLHYGVLTQPAIRRKPSIADEPGRSSRRLDKRRGQRTVPSLRSLGIMDCVMDKRQW
ncbi:hypothetical protein KXX69_007510, partial [Aspergillus fumigatus]